MDTISNPIPLSDYATAERIPVSEVWRRIRSGQLVARPIEGKILIVGKEGSRPPKERRQGANAAAGPQAAEPQAAEPQAAEPQDVTTIKPQKLGANFEGLPDIFLPDAPRSHGSRGSQDAAPAQQPSAPLPEDPSLGSLGAENSNSKLIGASAESSVDSVEISSEAVEVSSVIPYDPHESRTEIALLLDHLSIAKEEHKELLRLTQSTVQRVTEMSESIVSMKDEAIASREQEIDTLRVELEKNNEIIRKLRQQNEDLEMLAKSVTETPQSGG